VPPLHAAQKARFRRSNVKLRVPHLSRTILGRLLLYLSLASIPLVALAVYLALDEGRQADAGAIAQERMATQLVSQDLSLIFQLTRNMMQGLIHKGNEEAICAAIKGNLDEFPHLLNLALAEFRPGELESTTVCSVAGAPRVKQALLKEEEAQLTMRLQRPGDVVVTPVRASILTGQPVVVMIALVAQKPDGRRQAVTASINLDWLNKRVNTIQVPAEAGLLVLDRNGVIMARNPPNKAWPVGHMAPQLETTFPERQDFEGEITGDGRDSVKRYYTVRRISGAEGMVVLMKRRSEVIFAASRRHLAAQLITIAAVFFVIFGFAWLSARKHIGQPVARLREAADRVAAGDLKTRAGLDYTGDFGKLAQSFDTMAASIERQDERNRELLHSIRRSERRFREHLENAELLAVMLDENGCITFCNDYLLQTLGYTREELIGRRGIELVAEEDREHSRQSPDSQLQPSVENRILTKDGAKRLIRWNNTFLRTDSGAYVGLCGLGVDITEHRALLEQRLQSDRLESLGRLAAGVAHDFNNLLTVINGYSDLALRGLAPDHALRKSLSEVRRAGEQATALTRQLLTFSRAHVSEAKPFEINAVIRESESMFSQLLGGRIELETRLSPAAGQILADKAQLQQVLMNLMTNSMHAMPAGGTIVIETSVTPHPAGEPGDWVLLSLRDTGVGMDQETLAHIFDPFYTTRKDGKGTGLGLSIVYGIVRQSNGHLKVESQPGIGTTFRIWWQRASAAASPAAAGASRRERETPETILLVEDREEVRNLMAAILGKAGYQVLAAPDAAEAIRIVGARAGEIDLLLTDVVMPGMNGRELAERLSADDPRLKVILMSGFAAEVIKPGAGRSSPFAFLQKPVTADALTAKVREILSSRLVTA